MIPQARTRPLDIHASLAVALPGMAGSRERIFRLMYLAHGALKEGRLVGVRLA
ncbi:hypothetical protein [Sorangium sp. So ce233]|uniref:hypothetical protein n=1 Tax=Sorangium sp. So ce233 TaxID=3133290 RepID=UPI003F5E32B3